VPAGVHASSNGLGCNFTSFVLEACREAWHDAGMPGASDTMRVGLALGTAEGSSRAQLELRENGGARSFQGRHVPAHAVTEEFHLDGPICILPVACAAGGLAVISAYLQIQQGRADAMLAAGAESLSHVPYAGFSSLRVLTGDCTRPFDRGRSGFLLGEGAGVVVLETLDSAKKRGAHIYAEVRGFGMGADAHHIVHPHPGAQGLIAAMNGALRMSGCSPDEIDYVNAHGTATVANDRAECLAMRALFRNRRKPMPTSSLKAVLGHTMGAAGVIETVGCLLALQGQCIPPTWNFEEPDPECDVDCVPNQPRPSKLRTVMKNSAGFGGSNCSVVFSSC
jgi:3-oxoacyl-[acyl-carrier-protein] synthase II